MNHIFKETKMDVVEKFLADRSQKNLKDIKRYLQHCTPQFNRVLEKNTAEIIGNVLAAQERAHKIITKCKKMRLNRKQCAKNRFQEAVNDYLGEPPNNPYESQSKLKLLANIKKYKHDDCYLAMHFESLMSRLPIWMRCVVQAHDKEMKKILDDENRLFVEVKDFVTDFPYKCI